MICYTSKIILKTILCFIILSTIDELMDVQSNDTGTESSDTDSMITREDISLESYIKVFTMETIDIFHIRCHLTMLVYIQNGLPEKVKFDDIKHFNYMVFRSCTREFFYYIDDLNHGGRFQNIEKWTDNTDIESEVKLYLPINIQQASFLEKIDAYAILERNKPYVTKKNYEYCKTTLSNLSEPTNKLKTGIIDIFMKKNIVQQTKVGFPTMYFGFILYLIKNEEVEDYKRMQIYGDRLNFVYKIVQEGLLDIFRGLTKILYKTNLKIPRITNSQQDREEGNQTEDFVHALNQVFDLALETADKLYVLKINNRKQRRTKTSLGQEEIITKRFKKKKNAKQNPLDSIHIYMNHVKNYGLSNEAKYNPDDIPDGSRLFKDNKVQPSILQYYSVLSSQSDWTLPFKILSGMNDMEVLLLELHGWLKVVDYVVMDNSFKNKHNKVQTDTISTYKEWVRSAIYTKSE